MGGLSIGSGDFIKYIYRGLKPTYSTLQPLVDYCNCWIRSVANGDIVIIIVTIEKLGWPGLEFTIFITINLEGYLFKMEGVRPSIYPTYRIAITLPP